MKLKSYFAESVEAAVNTARMEMGLEAMLVSSKRTSPESRHLGEYEVVFAGGIEQAFAKELSSVPSPASPAVDRLAVEVADLRRELERTVSGFRRAGSLAAATIGAGPDMFRMFSSLTAAGLDPEVANHVLSVVRQDGSAAASELEDSVREELRRLVLTGSPKSGIEGPQIMVFTGPPGAGKTTTLVKLAVTRGLALRKRVHLISTDAHRIGGAEQLRSFAAVLGVSFELVEGKAALSRTLDSHRNIDLILIDTPGFDAKHGDLIREAAGNLAAAGADTCLVLPASAGAENLRRMALLYEPFQAAQIIFTKLDEAESYGTLLSHSLWCRKPIAFLSDGQAIPEDIRPAEAREIADLILGRSTRAAAVAA